MCFLTKSFWVITINTFFILLTPRHYAPVLLITGALPLLLCFPFLVSPAFFWSRLLRLTNVALPFGPSLRAFSALKQAAYAPPSFSPPHLPNFCPSEPYLSQPPPPAPPCLPLPNHFFKSSLVIEPQ